MAINIRAVRDILVEGIECECRENPTGPMARWINAMVEALRESAATGSKRKVRALMYGLHNATQVAVNGSGAMILSPDSPESIKKTKTIDHRR